jgi:hypothetical protein
MTMRDMITASMIVLREVFNVDEKSHVAHMKAAKQNVLDGASKWSAKLTITGNRSISLSTRNVLRSSDRCSRLSSER